MKSILPSAAIVLITCLATHSYSQNCVDSTLIDPDALCPLIWAPVCGCNGITYANDCEAVNYGGVLSWTPGECSTGCMDMSGLDFGMCDMFLGYTWLNGNCAAVSGCGYTIGNIDYSPNFYTTAWECQQNCGNPLTDCINQWQIEQGYLVDCSPDVDPVCGCNGIEYSNACSAFYYGGVTSFTNSPCNVNDCSVIPSGVDFGACAMPLGWARLAQGCTMLSGCSYIGQNSFDYSTFFFATETDCMFGCNPDTICVDSMQIDLTIICPAVFDPVCGCNEITYNNSCEATYYGGVTTYTTGPCSSNFVEALTTNIVVFPNPFNDQFLIQVVGNKPASACVLDMTGRIIARITASQMNESVDTSNWPAGVYLLQTESLSGRTYSRRIIKE
jgi:hypothetical protein